MMTVEMEGEVGTRAAQIAALKRNREGFFFSALNGSTCENFLVPPNVQALTVGRGRDVDILLADTSVSRQHAQIQGDYKRVLVTDLESSNGVYVNGHQIEYAACVPGDILDVGMTSFLMHYIP